MGLLGHMVALSLVFLRSLHTVFHSGCTNWFHSGIHQFPSKVHESVLFFTSSSTVVICILSDDNHSDMVRMITILTCVRWYLIVILTSNSLMISSIEHLFLYLLAIYLSSLEKHLFSFPAHFLIGLFVVLMLSCMSCFYMLESNPLFGEGNGNPFQYSCLGNPMDRGS